MMRRASATDPVIQRPTDELGAVVEDQFLGPASAVGESIQNLDDRGSGNEMSTSAARLFRLKASPMLNLGNFRPVTSRSSMKSMDQWLCRPSRGFLTATCPA